MPASDCGGKSEVFAVRGKGSGDLRLTLRRNRQRLRTLDLYSTLSDEMERPKLSLVKFCLLLLLLPLFSRGEDRVSPSVTQIIIGIAPTWDSMNGRLQRFDKTPEGWRAAGPPVPVLFGKSGLAWGRGLIDGQGQGPVKMEHDHRAPAGVFRIGTIYTYDRSLPPGANYPFHTVGEGDAWVDDVRDPHYNEHVTVDAIIRLPGLKNKKCGEVTLRIAGSSKFGTMQTRLGQDMGAQSFSIFGEGRRALRPDAPRWPKKIWWN